MNRQKTIAEVHQGGNQQLELPLFPASYSTVQVAPNKWEVTARPPRPLAVLISTKQAARLLHCHPRTVCRMIEDGILKAQRLPVKCYKLKTADVLQYLSSRAS